MQREGKENSNEFKECSLVNVLLSTKMILALNVEIEKISEEKCDMHSPISLTEITVFLANTAMACVV